jgi:hypothetical protein
VKVDPADLERDYGAGVKLKRVFVQITDDDVTTGIEKRLVWVTTHRGSLAYSGKRHPQNPEKDLTPRAFSEGVF